jgi:molybdate transport system substrate-binding protein
MRTILVARRVLAVLLLWLVPVTAAAQELRTMVSGAFTEAYRQVIPEFERTARYRVVSVFGASMGGAPDSIPVRLAKGEPADVVIMAASAVDELIRQGRVKPGTRVDLVSSSIGMAVRAGALRPDISTVDALRRTLLDASSIAYSASASGTYLSTELFPRLGIADQIAGKSRRIESERVGAVVAIGDA